jgi:hypothetical protein
VKHCVIIFALILSLILVGCGGNNGDSDSTNAVSENSDFPQSQAEIEVGDLYMLTLNEDAQNIYYAIGEWLSDMDSKGYSSESGGAAWFDFLDDKWDFDTIGRFILGEIDRDSPDFLSNYMAQKLPEFKEVSGQVWWQDGRIVAVGLANFGSLMNAEWNYGYYEDGEFVQGYWRNMDADGFDNQGNIVGLYPPLQ